MGLQLYILLKNGYKSLFLIVLSSPEKQYYHFGYENDQIDVNFIARNNFNNNAYKNNFGGNNYRPYPNNNGNSYGNSYGNAYKNPKSSTSNLENMLKEFISSQFFFNKTVEEKLEILDNVVVKVDSLAHDVEILKIRTTPLEVKKSEPINAIEVQINDNIRMLAQIPARI